MIEYTNTLQKVLHAFGLEKYELIGKSLRVSYARNILRYMLYKNFNITYRQIAELTGCRDHTSVINSIRKIEKQIKLKQEAYYLIPKIEKIEL